MINNLLLVGHILVVIYSLNEIANNISERIFNYEQEARLQEIAKDYKGKQEVSKDEIKKETSH